MDLVVGADQAVVEPIVTVDDPEHRRVLLPGAARSAAGAARRRPGARGSSSPRAACPSGEPAARGTPGAGRTRRARLLRVDRVQRGEHVDQPPGDGRGAVGAERLELRPRAVRRAVDPLHHVERCAQHRVVCAVREGAGDRDVGAGQRGHRGVLAGHVVCGGLDVAQRRSAHDPPLGAVGDLVGQVRLAAGDHPGLQVARDLARPLAVVPGPERAQVEPGDVVVRSSSVIGPPP